MEIQENRKKLFIELSQSMKESNVSSVLNNWSRPPPLQYHLINTPALNFQLASLTPQPQKSLPDFFKGRSRDMARIPKRNKQRDRFKRLREQLKTLEEGMKDFNDLHQSELLAYKQTLLVDYLSKFIQQTDSECTQKGEFVKQIWNLLIRIFQGLFERLVDEGKRKQSQYLKGEMTTHCSYQAKLEEYKLKNNELRESDTKYQNIIRELMTTIAKLNTQLKGQRGLFDKTASNLTEIAHKYEQLRSQYLEILVNGLSETMTRERAELQLTDKELLLFSKQINTGIYGVRAKRGKVRKAQIINNEIDVNLLLQEIEAQDDYSFEIDNGGKKEVNYANQRVQTTFVGYQGENMGVQCDYISRTQQGIIKNKSSQTNPPNKIVQREALVQTNQAELLLRKFQTQRIFSFIQYPTRVLPLESIKLLRNSSNECLESTFGKRQTQMEDAFTSFTIKDMVDENETPPTEKNISNGSESIPEQRESKMIRLNSKISNRGNSKMYMQRTLKTEASDIKIRNSQSSKKSVRLSEFLILENLKQAVIKNVSNFKKIQNRVISLQQKLRAKMLQNFKHEIPIKMSIDQALIPCELQFFDKSKNYYQNLQIVNLNSEVQEKIYAWQCLHARKTASFFSSHKCLKGINEIFKLTRRFIALGCCTVNLVSITCDYLSAVEGKTISINHNHKKLIDFLRSCLNLYGEHYLIRNFILLCGLQAPNKDDRLVKMSKISFDSLKQKIDVDRLNRTSDFKFTRQTRETQQQSPSQQSYVKMMYYSEISLYFELLDALNCSENKQDLSKYYTTFEKFESIVFKIGQHYKNSNRLICEIRQAVKLSIEDWGSENQSKLNIYKCMQLILQKILGHKLQIEHEFNNFLVQYNGDHSNIESAFADDMINLAGVPSSEYAQLAIIAHQCYQLTKTSDLATLFVIEGLKIDLTPFITVEKDHKVAIIKKLLAKKDKSKGFTSNIIENYEKKAMKKCDFHFLLRNFWVKETSNVFESIVGENLTCLFQGTISYGESNVGVGFHKLAREAFHFW